MDGIVYSNMKIKLNWRHGNSVRSDIKIKSRFTLICLMLWHIVLFAKTLVYFHVENWEKTKCPVQAAFVLANRFVVKITQLAKLWLLSRFIG